MDFYWGSVGKPADLKLLTSQDNKKQVSSL